jgi:hypothetical protein
MKLLLHPRSHSRVLAGVSLGSIDETKLVSLPLVAAAVLVLRVPGRPADGRSDREGHSRILTWLVNAVRIALNLQLVE